MLRQGDGFLFTAALPVYMQKYPRGVITIQDGRDMADGQLLGVYIHVNTHLSDDRKRDSTLSALSLSVELLVFGNHPISRRLYAGGGQGLGDILGQSEVNVPVFFIFAPSPDSELHSFRGAAGKPGKG